MRIRLLIWISPSDTRDGKISIQKYAEHSKYLEKYLDEGEWKRMEEDRGG